MEAIIALRRATLPALRGAGWCRIGAGVDVAGKEFPRERIPKTVVDCRVLAACL
jgi:hypothetical protein